MSLFRAALGACLVLTLPAAWGQAPAIFHATSELVLLDVQVVHGKTQTATGALRARDFELYEDGVRQEISVFGREQFPLSIVLLFDLTDSVRGVLRRLGGSAETTLQHLGPEDEVAVMTYAASARLIDGFTTNRQSTIAAIRAAAGTKSDEAAFFNEGIFQAAQLLQQAHNPTSRRVILWLTDNLPNAPSESNRENHAASLHGAAPHSEAEAIRALHESGIAVNALLLKDPLAAIWTAPFFAAEASDRKRNPAGDARKYAEITGGFSPGLRGKDVEKRLAEAIDDLRSRYTIGYRPSEVKPAGTFCRVRVALAPSAPLRAREWRVRVREGYYRK